MSKLMTRNNSPIESQVSIPDGWIYGLIGGLCSMKGGGTPTTSVDKYWADDAEADGAIPWISISDMSQVDSVRTTEKSITPEGIEASSVTVGDPGTVLFAMYASVGEVAISELRATWNQAIVGLTPSNDERLESRFLFYALQSLKQFLPAYYRSNTQNNLNANTVARFRIPLPPLTEQSRIADFLDEETGEIDRVVGVLDELIEDLDVRRSNTIYTSVCGRPPSAEGAFYFDSTNPKIGTLCHAYQPETISSEQFVEDGEYAVFGANGEIGRYDKFNHDEAQTVVTCRGATCGTVNLTKPFSWITGNAMVVRPLSDKLNWDFLYYALLATDFSTIINGSAQPQITRSAIYSLRVPLPSLDEQRRIADYLDEETSRIDKMKATATELRGELLARRKALITEYVTGQKRVE